jgi:type IV pilus modification protein PilV
MCKQHHMGYRQQGLTIIELLISLIIITIGLLGLAGLQLSSARGNHGAYQRSQASLLAQDLIERIRVNPPRTNPTGYAIPSPNEDYRNLYWSFNSAGYDCNAALTYCGDRQTIDAVPCNAFQMANWDLHVTYCGVPSGTATDAVPRGGIRQFLRDGAFTIDCNDDLGDDVCDVESTHTVTITWTETDAENADGFSAQSVAVTF